VAEKWLNPKHVYVVRARDELCPKVREAVGNSGGEPYELIVVRTCLSCPFFKAPKCPFYRQWMELKELSGKRIIVVTTHQLGVIARFLLRL
jgi:hypothetical protein